jgi:hypothetical protein
MPLGLSTANESRVQQQQQRKYGSAALNLHYKEHVSGVVPYRSAKRERDRGKYWELRTGREFAVALCVEAAGDDSRPGRIGRQ